MGTQMTTTTVSRNTSRNTQNLRLVEDGQQQQKTTSGSTPVNQEKESEARYRLI